MIDGLGACRAGRLWMARGSERLVIFINARTNSCVTEYTLGVGESDFLLVYFRTYQSL